MSTVSLLLSLFLLAFSTDALSQGFQRDWAKETEIAIGGGLVLSDLKIRAAEVLTRGRNGAETVRFAFESGKVTVFSAERLRDVVRVPPKRQSARVPLLTARFRASTVEIEFKGAFQNLASIQKGKLRLALETKTLQPSPEILGTRLAILSDVVNLTNDDSTVSLVQGNVAFGFLTLSIDAGKLIAPRLPITAGRSEPITVPLFSDRGFSLAQTFHGGLVPLAGTFRPEITPAKILASVSIRVDDFVVRSTQAQAEVAGISVMFNRGTVEITVNDLIIPQPDLTMDGGGVVVGAMGFSTKEIFHQLAATTDVEDDLGRLPSKSDRMQEARIYPDYTVVAQRVGDFRDTTSWLPTGDPKIRFIKTKAMRDLHMTLAAADENPQNHYCSYLNVHNGKIDRAEMQRIEGIDPGIKEPPYLCIGIGEVSGEIAGRIVGPLIAWKAAILTTGIVLGATVPALVVPGMFAVFAVSVAINYGTGELTKTIVGKSSEKLCEVIVGTSHAYKKKFLNEEGQVEGESSTEPMPDANTFREPMVLKPDTPPGATVPPQNRSASLRQQRMKQIRDEATRRETPVLTEPESRIQQQIGSHVRDSRLLRSELALREANWKKYQTSRQKKDDETSAAVENRRETRMKDVANRNKKVSSELQSDYDAKVDASIKSLRSKISEGGRSVSPTTGGGETASPGSTVVIPGGSTTGDCAISDCPPGLHYSPDDDTFYFKPQPRRR